MISRHRIACLLALQLLLGNGIAKASDDGANAASRLPPIEYTFEAAHISGNTHTSDRFFRALLDLKPGQRVTVEQLDRYRHRLMATGFFSQVDCHLVPGTQPETVIVEIEVRERNTILVNDVFLGVSADTPLWGGLEVAEINWLGTGVLLAGGFVLSGNQGAVRATVADPFAVSPLPFAWRLQGNFIDAVGRGPSVDTAGVWTEEAFEYSRIGGRLGLGYSPCRFLRLRGDYRIERIDFAHVDLTGPHPDTGLLEGVSLLSTISLDLRVRFGTRRRRTGEGFRAILSSEGASGVLGSDYELLRLVSEFDYGLRLGGGNILRFELMGGLVLGGDDSPYFEGFYVGDIATLIPSRNLGLQFTDRRSLDLLDNGADLVTYGDRFARFLVEWATPIGPSYGSRSAVELYVTLGLFGIRQGPWEIGRHPDFVSENGSEQVRGGHLDLTFDLGVRGDTPIGFFTVSLGNVLALAPLN